MVVLTHSLATWWGSRDLYTVPNKVAAQGVITQLQTGVCKALKIPSGPKPTTYTSPLKGDSAHTEEAAAAYVK